MLISITRDFAAGSRFLLTGDNGAGKTTLLKLIAGLSAPTSGRILYDGKKLDASLRSRVAYAGPEPMLYPQLTLRENLDLHAVASPGGSVRLVPLIEQAGLHAELDSPVGSLSSGQRQRAGILRALLQNPEVLLLDEPLSFLDAASRRSLAAIFESFPGTIIAASHETEFFSPMHFGVLSLTRGELCS